MSDPATVTTIQLIDALTSWGIDLDDMQEIRISADHRGGYIELRRLRRDDQRRIIAAGNEPATVTTVIGIVRPKPPVEVA